MDKRKIKTPNHIIYLSNLFSAAKTELFLVGGYVRNSLLSLPITDLDICSNASPDEACEILKNNKDIDVIQKALDFGTVQIDLNFNNNKYSFEHTTFRKDFYHEGGSHRPSRVEFTDDINLDASRRDFTVNSIYYNISQDKIIDPLSGINDLNKKIIRAAKKDPKETLCDDGLRIMRMARFAAELNFKIDPGLFKIAKRFSNYLNDISPERKQQELKKILLSDIKYQGCKGAFKTSKPKRGIIILKETNALKSIFPSLLEGSGVGQDKKYHAHDVLMHNINTMACSEPDYSLRLAGLLHDVAKPAKLKATGKMYNHDSLGSDIAKKELDDIKTPKVVINKVCMLIKNHMFDLEGKAKSSTVRKKAGEIGFENMLLLASLRRADFMGSGKNAKAITASKWEQIIDEMRKNNTPEKITDLNISGKDLMEELNLKEGLRVGKILERLYNITMQKPSQNKREMLLAHARKLIKEREI